jgi:hypothetical protein
MRWGVENVTVLQSFVAADISASTARVCGGGLHQILTGFRRYVPNLTLDHYFNHPLMNLNIG